jgi:hypothetical protein
MKHSNPGRILALAFCIPGILCFGQQNRSAICRLGDISNDSLLPYVQSLELDCKNDALRFTAEKTTFNALSALVLKGDAPSEAWESIFRKIKTTPSIRSLAFDSGTYEKLPYGYEGIFAVPSISFKNNEQLDYTQLLEQLKTLPNLRSLSTELYTIFDLPQDLSGLANLSNLEIVNTDEITSDDHEPAEVKQAVTYDYLVKKPEGNNILVKYTAMAGEIDNDEYRELAKRFTVSNDFKTAGEKYTPKYVHVNPPIKGIDVEREIYTINPSIENVLSYPSGTRIRIPANAFTSKDGLPVTSTIQVSYREFRDPVDFLVSGIPMKYDTGGTVTNFESAGMFELTASADNEPVQMTAGKNIDMNFNTTSKDSTYNFYSFNDQTGNWEYLSKPKAVTTFTTITPSTRTPAYNQYAYYSSPVSRFTDLTSFDERFKSNDYYYTYRKPEGADAMKDQKNPLYSNVRINRVRRLRDGTIVFKVRYNWRVNPEMREFDGVYFALNEEMKLSEFRKKYMTKKAYSDIRISASGNDLEILLKGKQDISSLSAGLSNVDNKGKQFEVKNTATRIRRYNRRLKKRQVSFDKELKSTRQVTIRDSMERCRRAFAETKKYMNKDEQKMNFDEWTAYCKQIADNEARWRAQQAAALETSGATASNLVQSLSLSGMGIYNCDQIQRMEKPVEIFAKYKTGDEQKISAKAAYVIDKGNNSVFQYDGYRGYSADKIAFDKGSKAQNTLLAIAEDGSISVYKNEQFKKQPFRNKEHFSFEVTKIDAEFTTVAQLKTLIGF